MHPRRSAPLVLALVLAGLTVTAATAAPRWRYLGVRYVTDKVDHDRIEVGIRKGRFEALQVRVDDRAVEFRSMTVLFGNGESQSIELRDVIPAGGQSRAIDLDGGERAISAVEFVYDAQSVGRGGARVRLYGRR